MLGMMIFMPSMCFSAKSDSTLLSRIWNYHRNYTRSVKGLEQNIYLCYSFTTERRNPTLFLVPTMYVIAKGDRRYIGESYCKIKFRDTNDYDLNRQVVAGTIPRQRTAMPAIFQSITPNFYEETIYQGSMLSPFHKSNKSFYRYSIDYAEGNLAIVRFKPRNINTQLISGQAIVDNATGRLQSVQFEGEFDMIRFKVSTLMNMEDQQTPLPARCTTEATFRFLGNRISSHCTAVYNCPTTLPDTLKEEADRKLMAELRPIPLSTEDQDIYHVFDEQRMKELAAEHKDTTKQSKDWDWVKEVGWDIIGDNLVNGHRTGSGPFSMRVSPLLNPFYLGYSQSDGLSYKLDVGVQYTWNAYRYLTLNAQLGYNFKQRQFYFNLPLRMNYNPKRNGYAEIRYANGNRISNGSLAEDFHKKMDHKVDMPQFNDRYLQVVNNIGVFDWLEVMTGVVYHRRTSTDEKLMREAGMEHSFTSFAPLLTLRITPWHKGPTLTANYERSIKNFLNSNLDYERWEFDASYKRHLHSLRILNLRAGAGFYTARNSNYFVDFEKFRANNLPQGWEDDWTGHFQLLNSRWYNESNYYIRGNASYDSPMMLISHLPIFGRYIETERIYLSALSIEHTRPYFELGYGFSNRYLSAAAFTSFLNTKIERVGFKITLQLFSRW